MRYFLLAGCYTMSGHYICNVRWPSRRLIRDVCPPASPACQHCFFGDFIFHCTLLKSGCDHYIQTMSQCLNNINNTTAWTSQAYVLRRLWCEHRTACVDTVAKTEHEQGGWRSKTYFRKHSSTEIFRIYCTTITRRHIVSHIEQITL